MKFDYYIGIGASAGGLESLQSFLSNLPEPFLQSAIIVAQHLSPTYKSMLVKLLSKSSKLSVQEAISEQIIEPSTVYITPPNSDIIIQNQKIILTRPTTLPGPKPCIDTFFHSLANEKKEKAIGIILSGTGSDGAKGVREIYNNGGITAVQDPNHAKYTGMPQAAIESQCIDIIGTADILGKQIYHFSQNKKPHILPIAGNEPAIERKETIQSLLDLISIKTKVDFSNYKKNSLTRRIKKRLHSLNFNSEEEYLQYAQKNPDELNKVTKFILIGVTKFFRDPLSFQELEENLKNLLKTKISGDSIRIWIPGCATGEEAYTIAIILQNILGKKINEFQIQIFATDINEESINFARKGIYDNHAIENIPDSIVKSFFTKFSQQYEVIKPIKQLILFSQHNLIVNPPFLKIDLISCRNLLIYFDINLQRLVIPIFHYILNENGILFLGKSETIGQNTNLFTTINETHKIFIKKLGPKINPIKFPVFQYQPQKIKTNNIQQESFDIHDVIKDTLYNTYEHSIVVINNDMDIIDIRGDVRPFMGLNQGSINANILKLINKELQIELRSIILKATKNKEAVKGPLLKNTFYGTTQYLRFTIKPLLYTNPINDFYMIIFEIFQEEEVTLNKIQYREDDSENIQIRELEDELSAAKEHLQTFIEELESNNEELQSLNEEFQSTNEELQSTNEELETTNEELQSTNEEIQIAYSELKTANQNLENKEKLLLESQENTRALLNNTLQSFILLDKNLKILSFNQIATDIFYEVSQKNLKEDSLIIDYINPDALEQFYRDFNLAKEGKLVENDFIFSFNKKVYKYNLTPVKNSTEATEIISFSLLDITDYYLTKRELAENVKIINSVFNSTDVGICITDINGYFIDVNQAYCDLYNYSKKELLGNHFTLVVPDPYKEEAQKIYNDFMITGKEVPSDWRVVQKDGTIMEVSVSSSLIVREDGQKLKVTNVLDVTENKKYKNLLQDTQEAVGVGGWEIDLITNKVTWTKEVYRIHELPQGYDLNLYNLYTFFEPDSLHRLMKAIRKATEEGVSSKLELEFISSQQNRKWVRVTCKPLGTPKTEKLFFTIQDITQEKLVKEEVMKLSLVASKTINSVIITNHLRKIEWVNEAFVSLTGYQLGDIKGKNPSLLQGKDTDPKMVGAIRDALNKKQPFSGEILNYNKDGKPYWVLIDITPIFNAKNELTHFFAIERDITSDKEIAEKMQNSLLEKEILLSEIHHRVKNNMAVISGLIDLQKSYVEDEKAKKLFEESISRIKTMALIHERLYKSDNLAKIDLKDYISELVSFIKKSYTQTNIDISININVQRELLDIKYAVPCGLIINELITNSITHAFIGREVGIINIIFQKEENNYLLEINDNGVGFQNKESVPKNKLGLTLVQSLTKQLKGTYEIIFNNGTISRIFFGEKL